MLLRDIIPQLLSMKKSKKPPIAVLCPPGAWYEMCHQSGNREIMFGEKTGATICDVPVYVHDTAGGISIYTDRAALADLLSDRRVRRA